MEWISDLAFYEFDEKVLDFSSLEKQRSPFSSAAVRGLRSLISDRKSVV